jgi:hypothetical protein
VNANLIPASNINNVLTAQNLEIQMNCNKQFREEDLLKKRVATRGPPKKHIYKSKKDRRKARRKRFEKKTP